MDSRLGLGDSPISKELYRKILSKMYGLYAVWEPAAHRAVGDPIFTAPRRKIPYLVHDLSMADIDIADVSIWPGEPQLLSEASGLGAMYVMEGATLGGQIIARNLEASDSPVRAEGHMFFAGYGAESGRMWRAFLDHIRWRSSHIIGSEAVAAAVRTFTAFRDWLTEDLVG